MVLFAFGCATVRMPSGSVGDELGPVRGIVAEPQVELWLESGEPVTAQEASEAREQARAALQQALETRVIAPSAMGAADPILVVRERGLSRTASRRRDQVGATIALAVGAVVVIAVVVALVLSGKDSGKAPVAKAAPAVAAAAPTPHAVPVPAPKIPHAGPIVPRPPQVPVPAPAPWSYGHAPHSWLWIDLYLNVPPRPLILRDDGDFGAPPPPEPVDEEPAPAEPPPLALPPPPPFDSTDRGFFSGDDAVLQFDLLDRATGRLLWSKTVKGGDPRDPNDVRRMVDDALASESWAARVRSPEQASR
jgi:hypothetical protein